MKTHTVIFLIFSNSLLLASTIYADDSSTEEPDPWDKSTDKYVNRDDGNQNLKVDVTEESESEVHTEKKEKVRQKSGNNVDSDDKNSAKETVDKETKQQFEDAVDEKDPAENITPKAFKENKKLAKTKLQIKGKVKKHPKYTKMNKKQHLHKKHYFNYHGDFYPGSLWEYPYPYYHPQYGCGAPIDCPCKAEAPVEAKDDEEPEKPEEPAALPKPPKTKKKQLVPEHYYGPPSAGWGGFQPGHTGGGWGAPYWYKKRSHTHRQLIPNHYYGPPSAGWGGFQPGHTGGGWGAPYWYKKCTTPHCKHTHNKHTHPRQLVPEHYYGPPSAGWGGFQPGHTGGGWGAPYWYKKCTTPHCKHTHNKHTHPRQLVPEHYYGPPSAGWGGFQPGHTGGGWGAPYWYKSNVARPKTNIGERKFVVAGNDPHGMGFTGNDGWDSGFGEGYGHSWGAPNIYGAGPYAHHYGGPEDIDYKAWHGPDSFGSKGWGGHGWLGDYGWMHGDDHEQGFGSGFGGWGNAGGDMMHLDEKIGEGDGEEGMEGFAHGSHGGGVGHMGHNSFFQGIGYDLAGMPGSKPKSKVPATQAVEINFNQPKSQENIVENQQEAKKSVNEINEATINPAKNKLSFAPFAKKTVKTRANNEKPITQ